MLISLDNGKTFQEADNVKIIYGNAYIPRREDKGEIHVDIDNQKMNFSVWTKEPDSDAWVPLESDFPQVGLIAEIPFRLEGIL